MKSIENASGCELAGRIRRYLLAKPFLTLLVSVAVGVASPAVVVAASIDAATVIRCELDARRDMTHIGMDRKLRAKQSTNSRFLNWMMTETAAQPRGPITFYWLPKTDSTRPKLRVQHNGQDRSLAKLLSRTETNLMATLELSDASISRGWLVSINFRREIAMITEIQSNIGGMRGAAFGFKCLFDTSSEFEPGLLGDRFKHLDADP